MLELLAPQRAGRRVLLAAELAAGEADALHACDRD